MVTYISHDGFARCYLIRETIPIHVSAGTHETCAWCGNLSYKGPGRTDMKSWSCARLFRYGTEADAINPRQEWQKELFCSIGCMRDYHR